MSAVYLPIVTSVFAISFQARNRDVVARPRFSELAAHQSGAQQVLEQQTI